MWKKERKKERMREFVSGKWEWNSLLLLLIMGEQGGQDPQFGGDSGVGLKLNKDRTGVG